MESGRHFSRCEGIEERVHRRWEGRFGKEVASAWVLSGNIEACDGASFMCGVSDSGRGLSENAAVHRSPESGTASSLFIQYPIQLFPPSSWAAIMVHTDVLTDVRKSVNAEKRGKH